MKTVYQVNPESLHLHTQRRGVLVEFNQSGHAIKLEPCDQHILTLEAAAAELRRQMQAEAPPVLLGPGGDYRRAYTPQTGGRCDESRMVDVRA